MAAIHEGARLKSIIEKRKIKTTVVRQKMGITTYKGLYYYYGLEFIKRSTLEKFCEALGVTIEDFYQGGPAEYRQPHNELDKASEPGETYTHQGKRLKDFTEERGMSVTHVAKITKVSRPIVYKWFNSEVLPEAAINKLLKYMNPPPPFLLSSGTGQPTLSMLLSEILSLKAIIISLDKKIMQMANG